MHVLAVQVFVALSAYWLRVRSRTRAALAIIDDAHKYQCLWEQLLADPRASADLAWLAELEDGLAGRLPDERDLKQCVRPERVLDFRALGDGMGAGWAGSFSNNCVLISEEAFRPVDSIGQLCTQASIVDLLLRRKVAEWAAASGGCAMVASNSDNEERFVSWADLMADRGGEVGSPPQVVWARLKTEQRAMEKVYRSYRCDVSRLLDVSRQVLTVTRFASKSERCSVKIIWVDSRLSCCIFFITHYYVAFLFLNLCVYTVLFACSIFITSHVSVNLLRRPCGDRGMSRGRCCRSTSPTRPCGKQAADRLLRGCWRLSERTSQPQNQEPKGAGAGPGGACLRAAADPQRIRSN